MSAADRRRVVVVAKTVPHYRARFFELARYALDRLGVDLELIQGQPLDARQAADNAVIRWAKHVPSRVVRLGRRQLLWQPVLGMTRDADLVIIEQASKLLANYPLILRGQLGGARIALWGHGRNLEEASASRAGEWFKRALSTRVHWWFAYNDASASIIEALGYPKSRVTSLQNTIDTVELRTARAGLSEAELCSLRQALAVRGRHVCVFVGGMYPAKGVQYLLDACRRIRERVPDFEMIFVGGGPDSSYVREAAANNDWIKYVGPQYGVDRVKFFALASLQLLPSAVGLGIIDSFTLGVPLVTTNARTHGPEISYLDPGHNGVLVEDAGDPLKYGDAVAALLQDGAVLTRLVAGCERASQVYSIESMVDRFVTGIRDALDASPGRE